jgi:hypothetical protein
MTRLSYELIDMILLKLKDIKVSIQLCRTYIAKSLDPKFVGYIRPISTMVNAIINNDLDLAKFLYGIGRGYFKFCKINRTSNREMIQYLYSIAEQSSNIAECHYYSNTMTNNFSLYPELDGECWNCNPPSILRYST